MLKDKKPEKKHIKISAKKLIFVTALFWGLSIIGTWYLTRNLSLTGDKSFSLLNPRLKTFGLDTPEERNAKLFVTLTPLKEEILDYLGDKKNNVAFYVEDLNTGSWMGWKEREPFVPHSLLKVPVAIGVMKKIDKGEWTLEKPLVLEESHLDKNFGDLWKKGQGTALTVKELMDEMLQNSDNTAANVFFYNLTPAEREDVYYHIGMVNPEKNSGQNQAIFSNLSPKDLAAVFRALYNATYLTRKSSEYILETLTKTKFDDLLPTKRLKETKVAHKIGNFFNKDPKRPKSYHDCGITYVPEHPYLYCIMTEGFGPDEAQPIIIGAGDKIYSYFNERGKEK